MPGDTAAPPSPYHSILGWAESWPHWQRDALRRIVRNGRLADVDLDELERICLDAHGVTIGGETATAPQPLAEDDLPAGPDATSSVTLVRLSEVANVNRLATGQTINFGPPVGLTIVFGENGSGKSGYARIVKKACRARGSAPEIKPNVLETEATGPAQAKLSFRAAATDVETVWRDGFPIDARLANIFVFDAASAESHVGSDEPACFTPRGLDVLPQLAAACDELKRRVKTTIDAEEGVIAKARQSWKARQATPVGKLLATANETTPEAAVEALAMFTEDDRRRLTEIVEALRSDPRRKAQDTAAKAKRIRAFAAAVVSAATALSDDRMAVVGEAITIYAAAEQAALATVGSRFDDSYLPGTGGDAWRRLWAMAEEFSCTNAYPGSKFPQTEAESRCVLCQRELDEDSRARFKTFSDYMRNAAQAAADAARRRLEDLRDEFERRGDVGSDYANVSIDLAESTAEVQAAVKQFVDAVDARLLVVQKALSTLVWTELSPLPASPAASIEKLAVVLDERAQMELSADDPENRKKLIAEREELEDYEWLAGAKPDVLAILSRYRLVAALRRAQGDVTTNQITIRSGELQDRLITREFCDAFDNEVEALGLSTLPVQMKPLSGSKGTKPFGIRLARGTGTKVVGIASEGEARCIAIAAFLAELSLASHRSALVFDDPVSSLDHARRTSVAKRLAKEAKTRQVVVFTHDCVFLCELLDAAEEESLVPEVRHLIWNGDSPGFCENGLPWDWQKYKDRIDALEKEQRQVATSWSTVPNPANVAAMRVAYSHFRATLERVLQDVIFNGVIARFRSWIKVENIEGVVGFSGAECSEVLRLHKRACDVTEAHDPATGKHAPVPTPVNLTDDINAMKALVEQVKARRRNHGTA